MQMTISDFDFRLNESTGYVRMCGPGTEGDYVQCFNSRGGAVIAHCRKSFERACQRLAKNAGVCLN